MQYPNGKLLPHTLTLGAVLALAACGGGGGEAAPPEPSEPSAPTSVTLSGEVARSGTLKNVVVCLDLNGNDACDSGEPASAATGADGAYSLTYEPAAVPGAAAARLIAPVKAGDPAAAATAIDSANPAVAATSADYVLKRPAGSGGAINPLTTLVQAGVAAGMTEAEARANVALQLAIGAAKIDNYQDDPAWSDANVLDTARAAATLVSRMLRTGVPLEVGEQNAAVAASTLVNMDNLYFQDAGNFFVQRLETQAKAAGSPGATVRDARGGKTGGVARTIGGDAGSLYRGAYLSSSGWIWCGPDETIPITVGSPNRSLVCQTRVQLGWSRPVDIAGQRLADFAAARPGAFQVADAGAVMGAATFPAGSQERVGSSVVLAPDIQIDNTYSRALPNDTRGTLEAVIAYYSTPGAAAPTGGNTLSLGVTTGALKNLRVSFGAADVATYYECDLNEAQTVVSNCAVAATGSYGIDTVNGERLIRFAGKPATPAMTYEIVYAQVTWPSGMWVFRAHEVKSDFSSRLSNTDRVNATAWDAMKAQLGL